MADCDSRQACLEAGIAPGPANREAYFEKACRLGSVLACVLTGADPYVAALHGKIKEAWVRPELGPGSDHTDVLACVLLDADGRIVNRRLYEKSTSDDLNRSVMRALDAVKSMDVPVPGHLLHLLTERGICFRFSGAAAS